MEHLDGLPYPDFSDFFSAVEEAGLTEDLAPASLVETSRGCWWAARGRACRFCGTPGTRRPYRAKSPAHAEDEIRVAASWPCRSVELVDDAPPRREFFSGALPRLAAEPLRVPLFCEVRPQVTRRQLRQLAAAGASVQPGIENLSDHVLRLMDKGSSALLNLRLLKWCRAEGVTPYWNFMHGVPGETVADYEQVADLLPAVRFLPPPGAIGVVRLDRHSAYAREPGRYGLTGLRSTVSYRYLYPFPEESLREFAFAFDCRRETPAGGEPFEAARAAVERWRDEPDRGELRYGGPMPAHGAPSGCTLADSREDARSSRHVLGPLEALVYAACDDIAGRAALSAAAARAFPGASGLEADIDRALARFVDDRVMVRVGSRYLSLALSPAP